MPHVEGVEHRFVQAGSIRMHVAEAGAGDPVVLLHGWPQHWYEWRRLIPGLAERYRVICPDLRGLGWTDAPPGGYEKETLAEDVVNLLDALELERVRLIGHDWGGYVGFLLCLHHPERFSRYLALNIIHPWLKVDPRAGKDLWRVWYQVALAMPGVGSRLLRSRPDLIPRMLKGGATRREAWTAEDLRAFAEPLREPARATASSAYYRTWLLREFIPLVRGRYRDKRLTVPTRLLFGVDDTAIPVGALEGYERHADDMSVELVPDTGHFIAEERPELVLERALAFFGEEAQPAAASRTRSSAS